ncbi:hypothetical protein, variant [Aphanomyces invadans]|nr:hypothetical protein, variant [Aphanomyces invadans]ETW01745.1 hypothetical protein, variant [Aphanomyces invadans]|eukprot:XP_008869593.1 hypothetical protein, variant [Aphanomyces invadans]
MDPEEVRIMFDFLSKCTTIEHAHVDVGKVPTKRAFRQKLIRLGLDEPYAMLPQGYLKIMRSISVMASKATELVSLHLAGIQIPLEVASDLASGLHACRALQSISFEGSNLGDNGLDILEEQLANRPSLCHLGLAHCKLTDTSARPLARIIRAQAARRDEVYWSTTLRGQTVPNRGEGCFLLNLESNAFGDAATDILCHSLYNDNWLYGLNLNGNTVGPRGVLNFADILQTNTTLTVLLLQSNSNTDDRVASFINTLLRDRQKATTSMNHPMEHMLLKAVLKSWGCRRRTAEDDLLAKLLNKRKKTSVVSKVDHRGPNLVRRARPTAPFVSTSVSTKLRRPPLATSSARTTLHSVKSKSAGRPQKAVAKSKPTGGGAIPSLENRGNVSDPSLRQKVDAAARPVEDTTALDMLVDQRVFRSNQEPTSNPAKRQDEQLLVKLMERISTLESAQEKAQEHIDRVEAENVALKQRLLAEPKGAQPTAEAEMIQALESAIVQLTAQVHTLEKTRKASPKAKRIVATEPLTDAMLDDLSVQLKRSFGLDE